MVMAMDTTDMDTVMDMVMDIMVTIMARDLLMLSQAMGIMVTTDMDMDTVMDVGVDNHHKEARVGVDQLGLVTGLQVPEDRSVVEVGQVDHVLALLELRGVDPTDLASLQGELLVTDGDDHLHGQVSVLRSEVCNLARLEETLLVAVGLGIHDPDRLLGVVNLRLVLLLHVQGGP